MVELVGPSVVFFARRGCVNRCSVVFLPIVLGKEVVVVLALAFGTGFSRSSVARASVAVAVVARSLPAYTFAAVADATRPSSAYVPVAVSDAARPSSAYVLAAVFDITCVYHASASASVIYVCCLLFACASVAVTIGVAAMLVGAHHFAGVLLFLVLAAGVNGLLFRYVIGELFPAALSPTFFDNLGTHGLVTSTFIVAYGHYGVFFYNDGLLCCLGVAHVLLLIVVYGIFGCFCFKQPL